MTLNGVTYYSYVPVDVGGVVSFVGIQNPRTATAPETTTSSPA